MKLKLTTDKIMVATIVLLLLSIATVVAISIFESRQVDKTARIVAHTNEVLVHTESLLSSVKDNESGSRGYVLTGQKAFLDQVERSKKRTEEELKLLRSLTNDNLAQQKMIDSLSVHISNRIAFSDNNIFTYNKDGAGAAMEIVRTGKGRLLSEQVRRVVDSIRNTENLLLQQRKEENERKARELTGILSTAVIGILLLLGVFVQRIRTEYAEKRRTAAALANMNEELEERVEQRTNELSRSKQVLSDTFERITDAFVSFDNNWLFTYVNKKAGEIFNRRPEDLIGKKVWTVFPEVEDRPSYKALHQAMETQQYVYLETHHIEQDLWFENHFYPSPGGLSVFFRDVTEKKRAEVALKASEEKRRLIMSSALDAIISIDENGLVTSWNPQAEKTFGWTEEQITGKPLTDTIIPVKYREAHQKGMAHYFKTGEGPVLNKLIEITAINSSGNEFPVELTIIPIAHLGKISFTAFIRDITKRKKAEEELRTSEERYRVLIERISDAFIALDKNWCYIYANKAVGNLVGRSPESLIGKNVWEEFPEAVGSATYALFHKAMNEQQYVYNEDYFEPLDLWQENHVYPSPEGISVFIRDISDRKRAEEKIMKANRLYFFISQVNQMIVRTTDQETLFKEACRIAVELGKFSMAWIGLVDERTQQVIPMVHAGQGSEYLSEIKPISIREIPEGMGPTGQAIRNGKYHICNDIESDPQMIPWKEAALGQGYCSSMALPIIKYGKVIGAFSFYAPKKNFFDESEIALLEEATGDVSFALEVFEKEAMRKNAEQAVLESERRYQTLAEVSPVGIFHTDEVGNTTYVNPRWCQISGMTYADAMGNGWFNAVHEEDKERLRKGWEEATSKKEVSVSEYRFVRPNGSIAWVIGQAIPERDSEGTIVGYVGTTTDITERKKAEAEIEKNEKRFRNTLDKMLEGVQIYDYNWNCLYVNDAAIKQGPYSKEQIQSATLLQNYPGIEHTGLFEIFEQCKADKISRHIEYEFVFPGGNKSWFELSIQPNPEGLFILSVDISERKKAQEAMKETSEQLRQLTTHLLNIREEERKRIG
ncbi:MAG TPA: PAS domain S-box protein, partial [Ferruginibacter sp.]|nr:PAS domain S-box protein [Ferruginibacter sp.]